MTGPEETSEDSLWRICADLLSARALIWVASAGRSAELRPEVHLYLYDRYWRLSVQYERRGKARLAERYRVKAERHYGLSGHDGPPFAADDAA